MSSGRKIMTSTKDWCSGQIYNWTVRGAGDVRHREYRLGKESEYYMKQGGQEGINLEGINWKELQESEILI